MKYNISGIILISMFGYSYYVYSSYNKLNINNINDYLAKHE